VFRAFLYQNGSFNYLPGLTRKDRTFANGINDNGEIVGVSGSHAGLWRGSTITDLHAMGNLGGPSSTARGINNFTQVVGFASNGTSSHAVLWSGSTITDLGTLGGTRSYALTSTTLERWWGTRICRVILPLQSPSCGTT
jgi:probable HAF family extracellular repeat protein